MSGGGGGGGGGAGGAGGAGGGSRRFNLVHVVLEPPFHGPLGYRETIETIAWGLQALGHDVNVQVNRFADPAEGRTNVLFGLQLLQPEVVAHLPDDTIVYNLEQIAHLPPTGLRNVYQLAAPRLRFWDYSEGNLKVLRQIAAKAPQHVPIGWAPVLERIARPAVQDIDVLMYGVPSETRLRSIVNLAVSGATVVYACGLYGAGRDELIARSKVVVNVKGVHAGANVFEVVRVSYLLANAKAVVSDVYPDSVIEPDLREALEFTPIEQLAAACMRLVKNEAARRRLETTGQAVMRRRDIREPLRRALEAG
jgi:hypothetical protein